VKESQYHPDCFNCHLCACNLDGVPFLQLEDSINCVDCYKRYKAVRCARCGEGITEENISWSQRSSASCATPREDLASKNAEERSSHFIQVNNRC